MQPPVYKLNLHTCAVSSEIKILNVSLQDWGQKLQFGKSEVQEVHFPPPSSQETS